MMKVRQNYTLQLELIQRLKKSIMPQRRSQFVEDSIRAKLDGKDNFTLGDYSDYELLMHVVSRNYNSDGTNSLPKSFIELIREHFE